MSWDNLLKTEPEPRQLDESLGELQRRELIRQREAERVLSDREYIFKHAITQEVTYQSVSLTRRKALHRTIAESIEALFPDRLGELAATLAYHYERAEIRLKAINYLTKAAERAQASYANEEAIRFFRASLKQAGLMESDPTGAGVGTEEVAKLEEKLGDTLLKDLPNPAFLDRDDDVDDPGSVRCHGGIFRVQATVIHFPQQLLCCR